MPEDGTLVQKILARVDSGFREAFVGHQYTTIQVMRSAHAEFLHDEAVSEYLSRFAIPTVDRVFGPEGAILMPGIRFGVIERNGSWRAWCHAEKSESLENGLFVLLDVRFPVLDANDEFNVLLERYSRVFESCTLALGLEWKDGI